MYSEAEYMTAPERFADSQIPLASRAPSIHDPSPFHERDLDPDGEQYIVETAPGGPHRHAAGKAVTGEVRS